MLHSDHGPPSMREITMHKYAVLDRIAAAQHGLITTAQARTAGVSSASLERRCRAGLLTRVHRGVYRCGPVASPRWREMAAVLACGGVAGGFGKGARRLAIMADGGSPLSVEPHDGAEQRLVAVSHHSAVLMLGLASPGSASEVDVLVARGRGVRRSGIRMHCSGDIEASDIRWCDGIPVTAPARTILDVAQSLDARALERLVGDAVHMRLVTVAVLRQKLDGRRHRRGTAGLAQLLVNATTSRFTRSALEADALTLIRKAGVPLPKVNERVAGIEVDLHWPKQRLVVELDSRAFHSSFHAQAADRRRDAAIVAAGYRVVRFTWRDVHEEPHAMLVRIAQALVR
jgi:very-short-patch-repair endonuclease